MNSVFDIKCGTGSEILLALNELIGITEDGGK